VRLGLLQYPLTGVGEAGLLLFRTLWLDPRVVKIFLHDVLLNNRRPVESLLALERILLL
jgi:hypothetical protein